MQVKKIYITDKLSPKVIHDSQGYIGTFSDTKDNVDITNAGLVKNDQKPNTWFLVLTDPDKITRIEAMKGFGTVIREVSAEPLIGAAANLKIMGGSSAINEAEIKKTAEKNAQAKTQRDMARYGQLFATICKNGGGYVKDADPVLIQEFETLQKQYGIEEKKDEEESS